MMKTTILSARTLVVLAGLTLAFGAQAAATWTFAGTTGTNSTCAGEASNSGCTNAKTGTYTASGTTATLSVAGYAAANGSTAVNSSGISTTLNSGFATVSGKPNDTWTAQTLTYWSGNGLAMASDGTTVPNHALDNAGANTESVLLTFSKSEILSSINLGYTNTDSDVSVWRFTSTNGTTAPAMTATGASYAEMVAAGWQLVGNYGDLSGGNNAINAGGVGSSWWLITAYNSSYGASTNGGSVNQGNDFFKIYAVSSSDCANNGTTAACGKRVPEPGSLALAGLALGGVFFSRRRKAAAV